MESFYPSTTGVQDFAPTSLEVFAEPFQGNSPIDGTIQRLGCSHAEDNMLLGVSPFYGSRASLWAKNGARRSARASDRPDQGRTEHQIARREGCEGTTPKVLHDRWLGK